MSSEAVKAFAKGILRYVPANDRAAFARTMSSYIAMIDSGRTSLPDPATGNTRMDRLVAAIIEYLTSENPVMTAQRVGAKGKKVGCARGNCGRKDYDCGDNCCGGYWCQPWWFNYWYNQFQPYYWWNWRVDNVGNNGFGPLPLRAGKAKKAGAHEEMEIGMDNELHSFLQMLDNVTELHLECDEVRCHLEIEFNK